MAAAEPDSEVHCLRTTMPSMSRLRKARAFFHDLPGRSGFGVASGAPASQARVSFVTRENVERSFMVLREGHQLDRSDLQHVQVTKSRWTPRYSEYCYYYWPASLHYILHIV